MRCVQQVLFLYDPCHKIKLLLYSYSGEGEQLKYLRVNISKDLLWTVHTDTVVKNARQRLYHLRQLNSFYSATIQSILTEAISVWYGTAPVGTSEPCRGL